MASTWGTSWGTSWGVSWGLALVAVPDVSGLTQAAATAALQAAGFVVAVTTAASSAVPAGDVISQQPAGGSTAPAGSTVTLTVSTGEVDLLDPKFQGPSHNTRIRWQKKVKSAEAETPPAKPPAAATAPAPKPRSTGLGEITPPPVEPVAVPEIQMPELKVVAPPKAPAELAPPAIAPAPAAPAVSPDDLARLEREMTAFVEGTVAGLTKRIATLDALLQERTDELAAARKDLAALRRAVNQQRAEALARRITEEE